MYDWEVNAVNRQKFQAGEMAVLNTQWSGYSFLNKEFGNLFPRRVKRVNDDVVEFLVAGKTIQFASQALSHS